MINCFCLLLLQSSPCYIAPYPWSHILIDFNHDEEQDAVDDDHAKKNSQIPPLRPVHINLEDIF